MTWNAFINWIYSLFIFGDKEIKQVLQNQADAHDLLLQILSEVRKINAAVDPRIATETADLKAKTDKVSKDLAAQQ